MGNSDKNTPEIDYIFWDQNGEPRKKFKRVLTENQAICILDKLSLSHIDNPDQMEEIQEVKNFIKNRQ